MNDLFLNYDQIAPEYDQRYPSQRPTQRGLALLELARQVQAENILEVGCGTGFWLNLFNQVTNRLYGLDYSAGMLEQARKHPAPLQLTRGTALHLPYRDRSFELAYSVDAVHHFVDQPAFITEAFRVLRPGGALAIIGFDPHAEMTNWYIYEYFDGVYETDIRRYASEEAILNWLQGEGFENVSAQTVEHVVRVQIGEEILQDPFLKHSSTSQLALLGMDEYQAGIEKIKSEIAEAERRAEHIHFHSDLFIKMYLGYKQD